ncbi:MAG TPA: hypothetical protein VLG36_00185 [Candidatus Chromulinivoraceae bacterium]|nr:hypothetical protein [Candidatus Chromulinivoraceae bacterium]
MIEDEKTPEITSDDMDTLRVLLHTIRGISPVSTTTVFAPVEDEQTDE